MPIGHVIFARLRQNCRVSECKILRNMECLRIHNNARYEQNESRISKYLLTMGGIQSKTTNIHIVTHSAFPLHCQNNPKPTNRFFFHRLVPNVLVSYHKVRPTRRDALHPFAHRVSMVLFAVPSLLPSLYVLARPLILEGTPRQGNLRSLHYARSLASCRSRAL